jgi:hypothetical protein
MQPGNRSHIAPVGAGSRMTLALMPRDPCF